MSELRKKYNEQIRTRLQKKFKLSSIMAVPKVVKVSINMGMKDAITNSKRIDEAINELTLLAGQKAVVTRVKKSVAAFKIRDNMPIATKVTLRGDKMYIFLEKLFNVCLPGVRDFRGLSSNSFDSSGNYSFGVKEHMIFPEIDYDKISVNRGMDITIVTDTTNIKQARELLIQLGAPLKKTKEEHG